MDEFCFLNYFILDNLKSFKAKLLRPIEGIEDIPKVILHNYFILIPIQIRLVTGKLRFIRHSANLYTSILRYLHRDVNFIDVIIEWIFSSSTLLAELQKLVSDTEESIVSFDVDNKEFMALLFNSTLPDIMLNQFNKLTDLIKSLESELKSKRRHEIDLLNIC